MLLSKVRQGLNMGLILCLVCVWRNENIGSADDDVLSADSSLDVAK